MTEASRGDGKAIATRGLLLVGAAAMCVAAGLFGLLRLRELRFEDREWQSKGRALAEFVASRARGGLLFEDDQALRESYAEMLQRPDVEYVLIVDASGRRRAGQPLTMPVPETAPGVVTAVRQDGDLLHVSAPILANDGRPAGAALIGFTMAEIRSQQRGVNLIAGLFAVFLVAGAAVIFVGVRERAALRHRLAVAELEREMAIARQIQTSLLPRDLSARNLEIAARMTPAAKVGGDYYDVQPARGGGYWIGLGDVSGHGIDAGLVMLMIQSGLASLFRQNPGNDLPAILTALNGMLHDNIRIRLGRDDFATLVLLRCHPDGRVELGGAHEEIVLWRAANGRCERHSTEGAWLGALDGGSFQVVTQTLQLEDGDVMVLYTDGVTEARSPAGQPFGPDRLQEELQACHAQSTDHIRDNLLARVSAWSPVQEDDRTVVVVRYRADAARHEVDLKSKTTPPDER